MQSLFSSSLEILMTAELGHFQQLLKRLLSLFRYGKTQTAWINLLRASQGNFEVSYQ
jgi:hypothetical protein